MFYSLQLFADWLVFQILGLEVSSQLGVALNFFIYDVLKIFILLVVINYLMAIVRYYLPVEKIKEFLASHEWYGFDYLLAALFGTITPFCSCSSIPLFVGFLEAGIPLGTTMSFLITSPLVNEVAVVLFLGLFGWKITVMYVVASVILGVVGGFIISKLKLEKYVADYVWEIQSKALRIKKKKLAFSKLLKLFWKEGWGITKKIMLYVVVGVGIGSIIHGFVPENFFAQYMTEHQLFAVPVATVIAVPLYASAVGVIPIMQSLVAKGVPLGTAMAFMMAVVGLSLPAALILKRVMKLKLLLYFFGITTLNIIIIGYLFNLIA